MEGFYAFGGEEETMRHLGGVKPRPQIWRAACGLMGAWLANGFGMFSVIERETGEWVGRIGPHYPEGWPAREVGWGVRQKFAGRGYAFEAAEAAINFAFDSLDWDSVHHVIDPANTASIRLAERLGSPKLRATTLPAPYNAFEVDLYGQTRDQWRSR